MDGIRRVLEEHAPVSAPPPGSRGPLPAHTTIFGGAGSRRCMSVRGCRRPEGRTGSASLLRFSNCFAAESVTAIPARRGPCCAASRYPAGHHFSGRFIVVHSRRRMYRRCTVSPTGGRMPTANGPLGRLLTSLSTAPAPRHYPPTMVGRLCAALALQPLPKPGASQENVSAREDGLSAGSLFED